MYADYIYCIPDKKNIGETMAIFFKIKTSKSILTFLQLDQITKKRKRLWPFFAFNTVDFTQITVCV